MVDIIRKYAPVPLTEEQIGLMEKFCIMVEEKNKVMNLTSIKSVEEAAERHFLDSLYPLTTAAVKGNVLDVGSGGGFPAFPLAIASGLKITCLDATAKKLDFIKQAADSLGISGITALCGRAEELASKPPYRESFATVISRGVARLNILCEWCLPYVKPNGYFIAMKGESAKEEADEAQNAIAKLGGRLVDIISYTLPICKHEHNLVLIYKDKATPKDYPRHNSKITKSPL